jgi:hypothetical protein
MSYKFNGLILSVQTLQATDLHFAEIQQACIDEVNVGGLRVNNKTQYLHNCERAKIESLGGRARNSVTYLQRAYWIQTGDCMGLLP